jgi:hypothetical protein
MDKLYKIKILIQTLDERLIKKEYKAKKIFENEHFCTFEYVNDKGNVRKETIDKNDYLRNPGLIVEV